MGAKLPPIPVGTRVGSWTTVGEEYPRPRRASGRPDAVVYEYVVDVRCECGNSRTVTKSKVTTSAITKCQRCAGKDTSERMRSSAARVRTGDRFGKWTAVGNGYYDPEGRAVALCRCDCGNERVQLIGNLLRGGKGKNGTDYACMRCAHRQLRADRADLYVNAQTHGGSKSRLYKTWRGMLGRCTYECNASWERYGGRGIKVCDEWLSFESFRDWALANGYIEPAAGERSPLVIDRIDPDGNYEPANCQWVTQQENIRRMFEHHKQVVS